MRAVVQRVTSASVTVDGRIAGEIRAGLLVLLGVSRTDNTESAAYLAEKIANLRIFSDEAGKMNLSLIDIGGSALVVSQFTLYGDTRGGRRPSFLQAAPHSLMTHVLVPYHPDGPLPCSICRHIFPKQIVCLL